MLSSTSLPSPPCPPVHHCLCPWGWGQSSRDAPAHSSWVELGTATAAGKCILSAWPLLSLFSASLVVATGEVSISAAVSCQVWLRMQPSWNGTGAALESSVLPADYLGTVTALAVDRRGWKREGEKKKCAAEHLGKVGGRKDSYLLLKSPLLMLLQHFLPTLVRGARLGAKVLPPLQHRSLLPHPPFLKPGSAHASLLLYMNLTHAIDFIWI